jgi:putative transposase
LENCTHETMWSSVEDLVRAHVRDFVQSVMEDEVSIALERSRYERGGVGYRNGHRDRTVLTTFGPVELSVPRARLRSGSEQSEFHSSVIPKSRRLSGNVEALVVSTYLCGVSTRRSSIALAQALGPGVSRSTVSRCLDSLKPQWEAFQKRDLSSDGIKRLILDGTYVDVRVDRKSTKMTILVALGVRSDGQKVVLAFKEMASESKAAWTELLEDLDSRGMKGPDVVITDGSKGLESALAKIWPQTLVQRCTVHKERNLLAHAPEAMHEELKEDYRALMYAPSVEEALELRKAFLSKWRSKCPMVARSLQEAGDKLFTFLRFPPAQWKSLRTTNAIEKLNQEFKRRVKVQGLQPSGESVCMLYWALFATGVVKLKKVDGFETLHVEPSKPLELAA